jgi:O-antigen/teichoic acid export membrane protein
MKLNHMASRILAAIGAGAFGQLVSVVIQLASLPLFLRYWDMSTYGQWLMLSAIPAYVSMADVGMVTTAGNRMTMDVARGDIAAANRVFQSAALFLALVCAGITVVGGMGLWIASSAQMNVHADALACLMVTVLLTLFSGLIETLYRATGRYALGAMAANLLRLAEWAGAMLGLVYSQSFIGVALGGLLARLLGTGIYFVCSLQAHPSLVWGLSAANTQEVKSMYRPAMAFMAFPMANALTFQGMTLLIGFVAGPTMVSVFNAYRTVSRTAVQLTGIFGHALWAEFARLFGAGDASGLRGLYSTSLRTGALLAAGLSLLLHWLGPWLMQIWTHGKITVAPITFGLLLAYAAVAGLWHVPRVMLMAVNQHMVLAAWSLGVAISQMLLAYALTHAWGISGAALSVLLCETALAGICLVLAWAQISPDNMKKVWAS